MESKLISISDPLEVQFLTQTGEVWRPATVCGVRGTEIVVAFADHTRLALRVGGSIKFRPPQPPLFGVN